MESSSVVIVCEDAGAAAALSVVGEELARERRLRAVVAGHGAMSPFESKGMSPVATLGDALDNPGCVMLTGSTLWGNRIEAQAILAAKARGQTAVTFLDFWANYAERLSYPSQDGLELLPSRLAVIDEAMRDDVTSLGIDKELVVVTGSPAFDPIWSRAKLSPKPTGPVVFLSQPIEALFGKRLGYTERTVLFALARHVATAGRRLSVRPHPREDAVRLREIVAQLPGQCVVEEDNLERTLGSASVVAGMTTMALVEAALRGLPTLSIQLAASTPLMLPTIRCGATSLIVDDASLGAALSSSLPAVIPTGEGWTPGAAARVIALLDAEAALQRNHRPIQEQL